MLGLPRSTEVNRRVAKEKLYANAKLTPLLRDMIKDQIETVVWRNKLTGSTIGISAGKDIKEIQVFEVQLRQRVLDKRVLSVIVKAIPYKILFVLTFDNEAQVWIKAESMFYNTPWQLFDGCTIRFEGLDLDAVYGNLARQVAGGRLGAEGDIGEAVEKDRRRVRFEKEIGVLENKLARERQFNRQVELNGELKRLRGELEGMICRIHS